MCPDYSSKVVTMLRCPGDNDDDGDDNNSDNDIDDEDDESAPKQ